MEQKNNLKVIHNNIYYNIIKYRDQVIQNIKLYYVNIMEHLKVVAMVINANLLMVMLS